MKQGCLEFPVKYMYTPMCLIIALVNKNATYCQAYITNLHLSQEEPSSNYTLLPLL